MSVKLSPIFCSLTFPATGLTGYETIEAAGRSGRPGECDGPTQIIRMVTHLDVDRAGCERALKVLREVVTPRRAIAS